MIRPFNIDVKLINNIFRNDRFPAFISTTELRQMRCRSLGRDGLHRTGRPGAGRKILLTMSPSVGSGSSSGPSGSASACRTSLGPLRDPTKNWARSAQPAGMHGTGDRESARGQSWRSRERGPPSMGGGRDAFGPDGPDAVRRSRIRTIRGRTVGQVRPTAVAGRRRLVLGCAAVDQLRCSCPAIWTPATILVDVAETPISGMSRPSISALAADPVADRLLDDHEADEATADDPDEIGQHADRLGRELATPPP